MDQVKEDIVKEINGDKKSKCFSIEILVATKQYLI